MRDNTKETLIVRVDKYTLEINGIRIMADPETEAWIRALEKEQLARLVHIMNNSGRT